MRAAVENGDAKKMVELMRQDPGFNVNMSQDGDGWTLLHVACYENRRSAVIPLLLAHPDIEVNLRDMHGWTPFLGACANAATSCVREMLTDSRVKVNEPDNDGYTPLCHAAANGRLDIIKWWLVSERGMYLGEPGDQKSDAIGAAKRFGRPEVVTLLERFKENPGLARHQVRAELGLLDELAAEMFALVVFVSDELLQINDTTTPSPAARFFKIAAQLPLELQMVLCFRQVGSVKEIITGKDSEVAFKSLAMRI